MCILQAQAILTASKFIMDTASNVAEYQKSKAQNTYRAQVAINNAKIANDEALKQKQMGIDKARAEKIEGLSEQSKLMAQNSASGFDISSNTNLFNYEDVVNKADNEASDIKKQYDNNAQSYFNKAGEYLTDAENIKKSSKDNLFNMGMGILQSTKNVADKWFDV